MPKFVRNQNIFMASHTAHFSLLCQFDNVEKNRCAFTITVFLMFCQCFAYVWQLFTGSVSVQFLA
jgi:hypothetical protein